MFHSLPIFQASQYTLNPYYIPPVIVTALVLLLGFFVLSLDWKSNFNRSLFYLCLSSAIWLYGSSLVFNSRTEEVALFWARIFYIGFIFIPANIFHISSAFTRQYKEERPVMVVGYGIAICFSAMVWSPDFICGVRKYAWGFYPDAGTLQLSFFLFMLLFPALGMCNLFNYYRSSLDALEKKRAKYLTISFIFVLLSYSDFLAAYGIPIYPFGYLALLCFILSITYSIIKYHNFMVESHAQELEKEVKQKTDELTHIVEELRTTQVKLFETGKMSALASLSAGILHQISQPVTAIHGFLRFIKKEMKETETFYRPISLMEEQSVYLKEMLNDLMELIRHREIKKENININLCVKKATNLLTDELRIRRINWDTFYGENLPLVYADSVHLQQVFMNLMINAMEAMVDLPKGSKKYIKITTSFNKDTQRVMTFIEDNGPGISPEAQKHAFEPFFSTKMKGAGIGLVLCKDLITEHGGDIHAENRPEEGARFVISLPVSEHVTVSKVG